MAGNASNGESFFRLLSVAPSAFLPILSCFSVTVFLFVGNSFRVCDAPRVWQSEFLRWEGLLNFYPTMFFSSKDSFSLTWTNGMGAICIHYLEDKFHLAFLTMESQ